MIGVRSCIDVELATLSMISDALSYGIYCWPRHFSSLKVFTITRMIAFTLLGFIVQMLKLKLESEEESTMALELIRFIKKVLADLESEE
ncbi:hypothetical protein Tco_0001108 [Tanacetum coccineum]